MPFVLTRSAMFFLEVTLVKGGEREALCRLNILTSVGKYVQSLTPGLGPEVGSSHLNTAEQSCRDSQRCTKCASHFTHSSTSA